MSAEDLAGAAGVVLSLVLAYVPGLNTWFAGLKPDYKRLLVLALLFCVAGGAYALACAGGAAGELFGLSVTCDLPGLYGLVRAFVLAAIANQATYLLTPKSEGVRTAANLARFK